MGNLWRLCFQHSVGISIFFSSSTAEKERVQDARKGQRNAKSFPLETEAYNERTLKPMDNLSYKGQASKLSQYVPFISFFWSRVEFWNSHRIWLSYLGWPDPFKRLFPPSTCAHPAEKTHRMAYVWHLMPPAHRSPPTTDPHVCATSRMCLNLPPAALWMIRLLWVPDEVVPFHSSNNACAEPDRPHLSDPGVSWSETGARYSPSLPLHVYKQLGDNHSTDWPDWLLDWNFSHANIEENSAKRKFYESKSR